MSKKMDLKPMTHCFIPGCAAIAEWNKLLFFKMSFGDLPHWWNSTAWVAKHNTELPSDALICERHFEERFIDRSRKKPRLMVGTIPTLNLAALEVDNPDNLEFFCRMCAKKGFGPMRYRLEHLSGMSEVVRCCLGRYQTETGLPPGVCESCVQTVKKFALFVKQCEESQQQMLQLQKNVEEPPVEERMENSVEYTNVEANKENANADGRVDLVDNDVKSLIKPTKKKRSSKCFENDGKPCPDCGKLFKTQGRYYYHLQSHNGQEYDCQICGKKLARKDGLRKHLDQVHGGNKRKHKCSYCGETFTTRSQLKHHRTEEHKSNVKRRPKTEPVEPSQTIKEHAVERRISDLPVDH